jgi:hypothetical protein
LLNAAFWLVPPAIGGWLPGGFHAYEFFGFADYIIRTGHIRPDVSQLWYHNWPGFFIETSAIMQVLGISKPDLMITFSAFGSQLAFAGGLYLFFRNTLGRKYCWVALWLFSIGNWQQHNTLLPQAYAFVLVFLVLGFYARRLAEDTLENSSRTHDVVTLMLFTAITFSHLLTALIVLGLVTALHLHGRNPRGVFVVITFIIVASWTIYASAPLFERDIPGYAALVPGLLERFKSAFFEAVLLPASVGGEAHQQVSALRLLLMALVLLIGLVGVALSLLGKRIPAMDARLMIAGAWISCFALTTSLLSAGVLNRVYAAILPLIGYFGAKALGKGAKWIVVLFILVAGPLHIAAQEGNQVIDYIPPGYVEGLRFFHGHTSRGTVTEARSLEGDPPPFGGFEHREDYFVARYRTHHWSDILDTISGGRMGNPPSYIVTSNVLDKPVTEFLTGDPNIAARIERALKNSSNHVVYENGVVTINLLVAR